MNQKYLIVSLFKVGRFHAFEHNSISRMNNEINKSAEDALCPVFSPGSFVLTRMYN